MNLKKLTVQGVNLPPITTRACGCGCTGSGAGQGAGKT